jgi:hypothetical protein
MRTKAGAKMRLAGPGRQVASPGGDPINRDVYSGRAARAIVQGQSAAEEWSRVPRCPGKVKMRMTIAIEDEGVPGKRP